MALPKPVPGLVIRNRYLWRSEHLEGREEGQKDRPCAIVAAIRVDENGDMRVLALPITHSPPHHESLAVEIPAAVKRRLQLDDARSWIVLRHVAAGLVRRGPRPVCRAGQLPRGRTGATRLMGA